jgi:glycosyltransferase involved in cell wall biosynthesis
MTVVHVIAGLQAGGAESVLLRLTTSDQSNRHAVISLMDEGKYGAPLAAAGVSVHALRMPRSGVTMEGLRELRRLLASYRPDVVQTWMYHADLVGGVMARLCRVPRICWGIRSGEILWMPGQRLTASIRAFNALLSWIVPDCIICNSRRAAALHRAIGYSARKLRVVPNGVDTDAFRPDAGLRERVRSEWRVPAATPLIAAVGRDTPYKDHDTLIAAIRIVRDEGARFKVAFVGSGMDARNGVLGAKLGEAGLDDEVHLAGERDDMPAVMNALDLCVMSSAAEAFPSVLIEAMACGVPCVTTDVGDAAAAVGEAGWVVPPREPRALARAIRAALDDWRDPEIYSRRREASRAHVIDRYGLAQMVRGFRDAWEGHGG